MGLLRRLVSGSILRILLVLVVLGFSLVQYPPLVRFDDWLYTNLSRLRPVESAGPVAVIAIDTVSLGQIGPWPWPRSYLAEGIKALQAHEAKAIGLIPSFTMAEWNPGLSGLRTLQNAIPDKKIFADVRKSLSDMEVAINGDLHLQQAVRSSGRVVLPLWPVLEWSDQPEQIMASRVKWTKTDRSWQDALAALHNPLNSLSQPSPPPGIGSSFAPLSQVAAAHGYLGKEARDSASQATLVSPNIHGHYFPSLPMQMARQFLQATAPLTLGENRVQLGERVWQTGDSFSILVHPLRMLNLPVFSYTDLVAGKIEESQLHGKAVIIGLTIDTEQSTLVMKSAAILADLLAGTVQYRPHWAFLPELAALVFFAIFLFLIIPRLNRWLGFLLILFFLLCWGGIVTGLLFLQGLWLQPGSVLILTAVSLVLLVVQRVIKGRETGYEDLKLLGLSLQGQGMLDMAFDKFMQCPVHDPSVREILYNLGLDFERKRMFNKAVAVYQHLLKGGRFKDAKKKIDALQEVERTVVLGSGGGGKNAGLGFGQGRTAPTLGRYEVVRELGQGAMGTVYLGRDPKINREVAIKTLNIRDIEPQQVEEVKNRFYREAEAAGGLNHPNIVTIYDAGEEHDLAYMAMEYLKGQTLSDYCVAGKLLAPFEVLRIAAEIADALAYAHDNNVIHRDIKPANIMLVEGGKVKVTDFGIARVMSSSHTQTGTILGTPSYMSPEQVAGKKVDGRSDLFSLGVVCYELLTGSKPFTGDNIGALMFNISKADYVPLPDKAKRLPKCVYEIVAKLLAKGVSGRYKSACDVAQALRDCSARMKKP